MFVKENSNMVEALYWRERSGGKTECLLCPFHCVIGESKTGICRVKKNVNGKLKATAYGNTTSFNYDPVEKKPLYHFHPGASILSIGPNACNLRCGFCQNYQVSQMDVPTRYYSPEEIANAALRDNCCGVAYTYSEPLMWYEYIIDCAKAVREKGLKNVLVTNAHLEAEPYEEILPLIDALNIDIKSMDETFYKKICKGKLPPVLRNVENTVGKAHIEITNLVIPGLNDADEDFERLASFISGLDPLIPLHFSRYHPAYKMDIEATSVDTLLRAADIARKSLRYVYIGNAYLPGYINTACPFCGALLIDREHMGGAVGTKNGLCLECGEKTNIIDA